MDDEFIRFLIENQKCLTLPKEVKSFYSFKTVFGLEKITGFESVTDEDRFYRRGGSMTLSGYDLDTVLWAEHSIALHPLRAEKDVLSFEFSGCSMAVVQLHGTFYAVHIHSSKDPGSDRKSTWIRFMNDYPDTTQIWMFRPDFKETYDSCDLWGLITRERNCYSVFVKWLNPEGTKFELLRITQHITGGLRANYREILDPGLLVGENEVKKYYNVSGKWDAFWKKQRQIPIFSKPVGCGCCCIC